MYAMPADDLLLAHLNDTRASLQIAPLFFDPTLQKAAADQATYMATADTATHTGENDSRALERVQAYDYTGDISEIVYGTADADPINALNTLLKSVAHADILLGQFVEIGIASATSETGQTYWCIVLGIPPGASGAAVPLQAETGDNTATQATQTSATAAAFNPAQVGTIVIALLALIAAGILIYLGFQPPKPRYDPLRRR